MIDRIYLDDNEISSYPFTRPTQVYPHGLISDISILVDTDITTVCVYSIIITDYSVTATFTGYRGSDLVSIGYSKWNMSGFSIVPIIGSESNNPIGWVSFGSKARENGSYIGESEICEHCLARHSTHNGSDDVASCIINNIRYNTPETLNIIIAGDIGYSNGIASVITDLPAGALDADDPELNGSIISVNGVSNGDNNTLVIQLPGYKKIISPGD